MKHTVLSCLRSIFLVGLFVLGAAAPSFMEHAEAQITKSGHEIDYYSDANFTNLVGFIIFCKSGQTIRWGQVTRFSKIIPSDC